MAIFGSFMKEAPEEKKPRATHQPAAPDQDIVSVWQLARKFQVSERTIRNWRYAGRIPSIKASPRCLRFSLSEVERALSN